MHGERLVLVLGQASPSLQTLKEYQALAGKSGWTRRKKKETVMNGLRVAECAFRIGLGMLLAVAVCASADDGRFQLALPKAAVSDRFTLTRGIPANHKDTWAVLDGPGCIKHIFLVPKRPEIGDTSSFRGTTGNRQVILRIYFDDSPVPHVEAPLGDFFGVMHGLDWYNINTEFLAVKAWAGYNSYFEMPFAKNARVEFETGPDSSYLYLQIDWHRYLDQELREPRRFCARWRRENPTQRYGEDYLMLDADGPGQLVGFVYGVRLLDQVDRWSHGGADNVYLDGDGDHPALLRGIGGEDAFGAGYGGALHPPETHLYTAMPYYVHEDVGEARPAQRLVGYRFFAKDSIHFAKSIHLRFGCMSNDICSTVYWYQAAPIRPFVKMPDFASLLPGTPLARGQMDLPLPERGSWWVMGPLEGNAESAIRKTLENSSPVAADFDRAGWIKRPAYHGFVDFNHAFRPEVRGVGVHYADKAAMARCTLEAPADGDAELRIAWEDRLVLQVGGQPPIDLGQQPLFRSRTIHVPLKQGRNPVLITLTNTRGTNHGGWAFAFRAVTADGTCLQPRTD